jgi:hypothetical protein
MGWDGTPSKLQQQYDCDVLTRVRACSQALSPRTEAASQERIARGNVSAIPISNTMSASSSKKRKNDLMRGEQQETTKGASRSLCNPNWPTHRKHDDISFRNEVSASLRKLLENKTIEDTWGYATADNVSELLDLAYLPRTNLDLDVREDSAQALFLSTEEAKLKLGCGSSVNIPVVANGQQDLTWSGDSRPISQLLQRFYPGEIIYVNDASLPRQGPSYRRQTIANVQSRFAENKDYGSGKSWNLLDTRCPLPGTYNIYPIFLQNDGNCTLLSEIRERILSTGSAGRMTASTKSLVSWRDVERWVLLAEPGAATGPHQDSHGWETFITVNEGEIGFAWLDRPSEEDLHSWAAAPQDFRGGTWCYTVLRAGQTVWFPSGLVHFVFRRSGDGRQTMAISGHTLRYSNIGNWAKTIASQLKYPDSTNEGKMDETVPKYLEVVACLVSETLDLGGFGGEENVTRFIKHARVCSIFFFLYLML